MNTSPKRTGSPDRGADGSAPVRGLPVPPFAAKAGGYALLFILVAAALYVVFMVLARVWLAVAAVFVALVITALLLPLVDLVDRVMPRVVAVVASLVATLVVVGGLFTIIGFSVAGQVPRLRRQFRGGLGRITGWLQNSPLHIRAQQVDRSIGQARHWLTQHRGEIAGHALGGAGAVAGVFTVALVALFCAVFFLGSGERMWAWYLRQLPSTVRNRWDGAAHTAWSTFQAYARATVLVAASNAALVAVALLILRVPLALALALLVFLFSFIPLVGGAFSLALAALVALAARGPVIALVVIVLVPILGQIEGHVLQPLIMGRSVRLHPVVVLVTVVSGGLLGGFIGAVVAVPLVAVGWSVVNQLRGTSHE